MSYSDGYGWALRTKGLSKVFGGHRAVHDLDLNISRGEVHALLGPNGAGKTTVFNLLTKVLAPTSGQIFYGDREITNAEPSSLADLGLARSFQLSAIFPSLTVRQNLYMPLQRMLGVSYKFWKSDRVLQQLDAKVDSLLKDFQLESVQGEPAGRLPYGQKRTLELATTIALEPATLLLDEPTSGMGHEDIHKIVELIRRFSIGRTVVLVEHNLSVVSSLSDTVTVLARGQILAQGSYMDVAQDQRVVEAYLGDKD